MNVLYKCIDGKRHYYCKDKKCYKCGNTQKENNTQRYKRGSSDGITVIQGYESNKKWRLKHPEIRHKGTRRYYKKHKKYDALSRKRYSYEEEQLILTKINNKGKILRDVDIAILLRRSLQAIQQKRVKMKGVA